MFLIRTLGLVYTQMEQKLISAFDGSNKKVDGAYAESCAARIEELYGKYREEQVLIDELEEFEGDKGMTVEELYTIDKILDCLKKSELW